MGNLNSTWFWVSLVIAALLIIYGAFAYSMINRKRTDSLTTEEKLKLMHTLPKAISTCKIGILLLPMFLLLIPMIYKLDNQVAYILIAALIIMYIGLLEGLLLSKKLLAVIR